MPVDCIVTHVTPGTTFSIWLINIWFTLSGAILSDRFTRKTPYASYNNTWFCHCLHLCVSYNTWFCPSLHLCLTPPGCAPVSICMCLTITPGCALVSICVLHHQVVSLSPSVCLTIMPSSVPDFCACLRITPISAPEFCVSYTRFCPCLSLSLSHNHTVIVSVNIKHLVLEEMKTCQHFPH